MTVAIGFNPPQFEDEYDGLKMRSLINELERLHAEVIRGFDAVDTTGNEINDLSVIVTWANVPDANITQGSVTQHEAAIDHDALTNFVQAEHVLEANLTILESQITDGSILARVAAVEDISGQWDFTRSRGSPAQYAISVVSAAPFQEFDNTGSGTDAGSWAMGALSTSFVFRSTKDDDSTGTTWLTVNRTAEVVDNATFGVPILATSYEGILATNLLSQLTVITDQTALTSGLASTDELLVSDGGTTKRMDVSVIEAYMVSAGFVTKVGGPADDQIGVWTGDGTLEGDSNFTWDGQKFILAGVGAQIKLLDGTSLLPAYAWSGDPATGFWRVGGGQVHFTALGTNTWQLTANVMGAVLSGGPVFRWEVASATNPTVLANNLDADSGLGAVSLDSVSLIAGSIEGIRVTEVASAITIAMAGDTAITGALTATSYEGIAAANILSRAAAESINASWDFTASPTFSSGAGPVINSTTPQLRFFESDAGTDAKYWRFLANAESFRLETVDDLFSGVDTVFTVARSANVVGTTNFPNLLQTGGVTVATLNTNWAAGDITSGTFADALIAESNVTQHEAAIDHDALTNFLAAEHVDWAGSGTGTIHATNVPEAAITQHEAAIDHDALTNFVAAEHVLEANIDHDALTNFLAAEHVDWAGASAGTIHASNVPVESVFGRTGVVAATAGDYAGVTETFTAVQTFDAGIRLLDDDTISFGTGTDITLRWDSSPGELSFVGGASDHIVNFLDGMTLRVWDPLDTDHIDISHDGTDGHIGGLNSRWLQISSDFVRVLINGGVLAISEFAEGSIPANTVGIGQFWVKDDTPNKPMFRDDAGTDFDLSAGAAEVNDLSSVVTWANVPEANIPTHTGDVEGGTDLSLVVAAITSQTALTSGLADADELLVSDGGVIKRMDITVLEAFMLANLAFATTAFVDAHVWNANDITAGTLVVARGGTGVTAKTGTGNVVLSATPTFTGTPVFANIRINTNVDLNGNINGDGASIIDGIETYKVDSTGDITKTSHGNYLFHKSTAYDNDQNGEITFSTSAASGGTTGDIWFRYTA